MRITTALLLSLVFMVCAGACAGRQRPQSGPPSVTRLTPPDAPDPEVRNVPNDIVDTKVMPPEAPTPSDEVTAPVVTKKPSPKRVKRTRSVQERIHADARPVIDTNTARVRPDAGRAHGTRVPAAPPDNDVTVIAARVDSDATHRSPAVVAQATNAPDAHDAISTPLTTRLATRDARTRPRTPLSPRERERANAAALAALASSDLSAPSAAQSAPTTPTQSPPVALATETSPRRSDAAHVDSESSSTAPVDRSQIPLDPNALMSASKSRLHLYIPAIVFALFFGLCIGYVLSRLPARVSSFDDAVVSDVVYIPPSAHAPVLASAAPSVSDSIPVPVHVVPSPVAPSQEAMPPALFPDGSGSIVTTADPVVCAPVANENGVQEPLAPSEAPPPTNTTAHLN